MKKKGLIMLVLVLSLAMLFTGCGGKQEAADQNSDQATDPATEQTEDQSWTKIKEKGQFIVGLDDNYPPAGFRDEKGEIAGVDIDLAREAAKRLGVEVVFQPVQWDGVLMNLKNGDIDVIWNALGITPDRQKEIGFTDPYIIDKNIIIVNAGSDIKTKADLAGKLVGVQLGSTVKDALVADPINSEIKELREFESTTQALFDMQAGRLDAVVTNELNGRYLIAQEKMLDKFYILSREEGDLGEEPYGVGVRMEDKAFLAELNRVLNEMKADGTAVEISNKWFGSDIIEK